MPYLRDTRSITPHAPIDEILTGRFDTRPGYTTYRPGGTDDYLIFHTLAGCGRFETGNGGGDAGTSAGGAIAARPYELVLLPPGVQHDYATDVVAKRWKFYWAHFRPRPGWIDLLDWPSPGGGVMRLPTLGGAARGAITRQFTEIHRSGLTTGPLRTPLAMNAMERLLLLLATHNPLQLAWQIDPAMRRVMDFVAARLGEPLPVERLADVAGLSVSRFGHRFREIAGCPPVLFVERTRIDRAKTLLRMTPLSIKEIAHHVGFAGQFYFSLRFKKRVGMSPTAYRDSADYSADRPSPGR